MATPYIANAITFAISWQRWGLAKGSVRIEWQTCGQAKGVLTKVFADLCHVA